MLELPIDGTELLAQAAMRWQDARAQLQKEGVLSEGPWFQLVALGKPHYYADETRGNYYKVWYQGDKAVAVEHTQSSFWPSGFGNTGWVTLAPNPGFYQLPSMPLLRSGQIHFVDYYNMVLRLVAQPILQFTFQAFDQDYLRVVTDAEGSWRYWDSGISGPRYSLHVPPRLPRKPEFTECRVCHCTNDNCAQCLVASGNCCSWVAPYLCSRCYAEQQAGKEVQNG